MEDQSTRKLLALYNFIYKLNEMRFKAVKDIKQQNRYLFVKDIPISDYVKLNKHPLDNWMANNIYLSVILKILFEKGF